MKVFEIGFIDGHSLKYHYKTVIAKRENTAINYLFSIWGSNFENIVTSIIERNYTYEKN